VSGTITGIRFYKASANTGTHVGSLWTTTGQRLAFTPFTGETASGWQQVSFTTPVPIAANTVYIASYHTTAGHYSQDLNYFTATGVDNLPLHALRNGEAGFNSVYAYGPAGTFPTNTFSAANYWVDVVFNSGSTPTLTSIAVTPASPTIQAGGTQQFTATGTYSDNSTQNITSQVTWASSNTGVATIAASGLATGVAVGSTTISATQGGTTGSTSLTVQAVLTITTTSLPSGTVGAAYTATLAASNGTPPYTWSVITGSLPAGLTLNAATGTIAGTPTAATTSTFTVQVRDAAVTPATASRSLSITIGANNTGFLLPTANAPVTIIAGDNNGFETSPTNAYAFDGAFAVDANSGTNTNTSCTNTGKDKHVFSNYNIALPTGVAIRGIEVQLGASVSSTANTPRMCVQLSWNGGLSWTSAQTSATLSTTPNTYTLGGPAFTWGRTWTVANFANTSFRIRIANVAASTARTFSLDGVAVRITYQ
jgi:hypothetical protein